TCTAKTKMRFRILVGTDITDNYLLFVGAADEKFDANVDTIDAVWASFEIFSGGASGDSKGSAGDGAEAAAEEAAEEEEAAGEGEVVHDEVGAVGLRALGDGR